MKIYTETVDSATYELLKKFMSDPFLKDFNLVGGTSLSLQMGHRKSVDLDLFCYGESFDSMVIAEHLRHNYDFELSAIYPGALLAHVQNVKTDFIKAYNRLTEPLAVTEDGIRLVNYKDIAAMKLLAIGKEGTRRKDFIDIAFLSTLMSFSEMLEHYREAYDLSSTIQAIRGLLYFDDIKNEESVNLIGAKMDWRAIEKRLYQMVEYQNKVFDAPPVLK